MKRTSLYSQSVNKNCRGKTRFGSSLVETLEQRRLYSVNVLTWHNDNTRQGQNTNEVALTPSNVNYTSFGELFSYNVTGQVYAQPLYVSNLAIPGRGNVNVVFVATQNNDVYAFNANSNSGVGQGLIWHVNLGPAAATPNSFFANRYGPYHDINPQVGITSTPVIDLASGTMYIDAFTNDTPGQNVYSHHIHALSLTTGADKVTPMLVAASVQGNGVGGNGTTIPFVATQQLQRPALTLLNGTLYVAYSGYADTDPYHGWILGFNSTNLNLVSVLNTSPNLIANSNDAGEVGLWACGAGLASDGTNLFMLTANGDFDPTVGDYGDSFLRVAPDSSTAAQPNLTGYGLGVKDNFTPYNQKALADADADLGSGGGILLPDQPGAHVHEMLGAGKQGTIYLVDRDNMSGYNSTTDNNIQKVSLGHGVFGNPAYYNGSVYYHAVGDVLKRFSLTNGLLSAAPAASSTIPYSSQGATPSISSNGTANGIVWDVQWSSSNQVLHAYDATTLTELYNSNQNAARDQMDVGVKFITPTIADGEVFVGSADKLYIYGALVGATTAPVAPSGLSATALTATSVQVNWVDNSDNESTFLIERSTDNTNFTQIGTSSVNTTSFVDSTATASRQFYYRVRASNSIGFSAYTPSVSVTTPASTGANDVYHFDEATGLTTADSVGGNNGTLIGATLPTWVTPGKTGAAALSFSGDGTYNQTASQSAVQVSSNLASILGSTSSLDVWIKTTQVGSATHWKAPAITGAEAQGSANDINWGTLDANGHIGVYVGDNGGLFTTTVINDGQWHNIAMTRNATTGLVQIYVDGAINVSTTLETGNKTSTFKLIGALSDVAGDGVTRTGDNYFNGQLDEVRIYNQVLTANDVSALALVPATPMLSTISNATGPVVHLTFSNPSAYSSNIQVYRKTGAGGTYALLATLSPDATVYDDASVTPGTAYYYTLKAIDLAGSSPASNELSITPPVPTVVGNYVFYNNSKYDSFNGSSNLTDDNAIATDKVALLALQTASYQNITDYSKGINGIMVDVANLVTLPRLDDFEFMVGNNSDPSTWTQAPTPTYVNTYPGRGPNGSTQITLIWDDNAIQNEWLQVTVLAQPHLGLANDDVFYFGNAIGYTGTDTSTAQVTQTDVNAILSHQSATATVTNPYDVNRDGAVDGTDANIASANQTTPATALKLISLVPPPTVASPAHAAQSVVTGTSDALTVLGADNAGESTLTYTWSTTGTLPGPASFSANGTNAAKNTIAAFSSAGAYTFKVTITNAAQLSVTSTVNVQVNQTFSGIAVNPSAPHIANSSTVQLSASALDQFGATMTAPQAFTWSVPSGAGSVNNTGLYSSPASGYGAATVQAAIGAVTGTSTVTTTLTNITGTSGNDIIRLVLAGPMLNVYINNPSTPAYTVPYTSLGALAVDAGTGTDTINVDFSGGGAPVPSGALTINGVHGIDTIIATGTTGNDAFITSAATISVNATLFQYASVHSIILNGNGGTDSFTQSAQPGSGATTSINSGTSGGPSSLDSLTVNAGTFTFPASAAGSGLKQLNLGSLSIGAGASVVLASATSLADRYVLVAGSLGIAGSGTLDIGMNDLDLATLSLASATALIKSGFNLGTYNGSGITSSAAAADGSLLHAIGVITNNVNGTRVYGSGTARGLFDGANPGLADTLIKYTYYGDADLNGVVNANDYSLIDSAFAGHSGSGWSNGDFNFDGTIDGSDYSLIDNAFNTQDVATTAAHQAEIAPVTLMYARGVKGGKTQSTQPFVTPSFFQSQARIKANTVSNIDGEESLLVQRRKIRTRIL